MKRALMLLLVLMLTISLSACGEKTNDASGDIANDASGDIANDTSGANGNNSVSAVCRWNGEMIAYNGAKPHPATLRYEDGVYTLEWRDVLDYGNYEIYEKSYYTGEYLLIFFENQYFGSSYWDFEWDNELGVSVKRNGRRQEFNFVKQGENLFINTTDAGEIHLELDPATGVATFYYQRSGDIRYTPSVSEQIVLGQHEPIFSLEADKAYLWESDAYADVFWGTDEDEGNELRVYSDLYSAYAGPFTINVGDSIQFGDEGPVLKGITENCYISDDKQILLGLFPHLSDDAEFYRLNTDDSDSRLSLTQIDGGIEVTKDSEMLFAYSENGEDVRLELYGTVFEGTRQADQPAE